MELKDCKVGTKVILDGRTLEAGQVGEITKINKTKELVKVKGLTSNFDQWYNPEDVAEVTVVETVQEEPKPAEPKKRSSRAKKNVENQIIPEETKIIEPEESNEDSVQNFLMWVGCIHYPTSKDFVDESHRLGVSKRLGKLPKDLELGKSKVFLAHDDGITGEGFIFAYFIPTQIEFVCDNEFQIPDNLYDKVVPIYDTSEEEKRLCGYRRDGAYMVYKIEPGTSGEFVDFGQKVSLEAVDPGRKRFRGLLRIDYADRILNPTREDIFQPFMEDVPNRDNEDWTMEEEDLIIARLGIAENVSREAAKLAREMGRSKTSIVYRFGKLQKSLESEEVE